jgi:hypothetical protein
VHNSFSKKDPVFMERNQYDSSGEAHHYVSYINFNGQLYEMDGLQESPILHRENLNDQ